ncbi:MAG TPA: PIN domain-containing protein [Acidobacteriaceae bacterium]|nr:PIN domain-containing protein [Acidobacteriaceae bacterium]
MRAFVLDASALLRFMDKERGSERVRSLFRKAARAEIQLLMSAVNWGEVVHAVTRRSGSGAPRILDSLAALPMAIVPVDAQNATDAGQFQARYGVPYADSSAAALTMRRQAGVDVTLVTADNDFRRVPAGTMRIEFLPGK